MRSAGIRAGEKTGDEPFAQRVLHLFELAGEEVVRIRDNDERRGLRCRRDNAYQRRLWTILVSTTADEELGQRAACEKVVAVVSAFRGYG